MTIDLAQRLWWSVKPICKVSCPKRALFIFEKKYFIITTIANTLKAPFLSQNLEYEIGLLLTMDISRRHRHCDQLVNNNVWHYQCFKLFNVPGDICTMGSSCRGARRAKKKLVPDLQRFSIPIWFLQFSFDWNQSIKFIVHSKINSNESH